MPAVLTLNVSPCSFSVAVDTPPLKSLVDEHEPCTLHPGSRSKYHGVTRMIFEVSCCYFCAAPKRPAHLAY